MNKKQFNKIDAFIAEQMRRLRIPGAALAVVEGEQIAHLRGFGRARPGGETPSPQTPFAIGSTAKAITASAVMQLVEAGKIELDAPVRRYLPWFTVKPPVGGGARPHESAKISVRHLLNQTSGLPLGPGWAALSDFDDRPDACERQARALAGTAMARPAGAAYEYSNVNYNLLGLIIEAASGESYASYIQKHVFAPLDMRHSSAAQAEARRDGLAMGHRYWFSLPIPAPDLPMARGSLPSGQLIASTEDMAHFLLAHLNEGRYDGKTILSPAGIAELHRPAAPAYTMGGRNGQYAMGWCVEEYAGEKIIWHGGTVPDFAAFMALLPGQKTGVVLLINADHFMMNPTLAEIGLGLVSLLAGRQPAGGPFGTLFQLTPALLLIPLLQIVGVGATLRRLAHWRRGEQPRLHGGRLWLAHVLLPLAPNMALAALPAWLLRSRLMGFMRLYFPELAWIGLVCGGFAAVWGIVRSVLVVRSGKTG